jgi:hypothetical protein
VPPPDDEAARASPDDGGLPPISEGDLPPISEGDLPPISEGDLDDLARAAGDAARQVTGIVAGTTFVILHAVVGGLVVSLGSLAPSWAVASLLTVWGGVAVVGWRGRRRRPIVTMLLPIATAVLVLGAVALGGQALGWSA